MTLGSRFEVTLQFTSDWHVGTGQGSTGEIDATVRRDNTGLPYVPAKSLTGVWRDACEQVAICLDKGNPRGGWNAWVSWLFGSQPSRKDDATAAAGEPPRAAVLGISRATYPPEVRAAVAARPALQAAAVTLRPGVSIDKDSGTARAEMLRLEERARPAELTATVITATALPLSAELLLRAGAVWLERLGGKRNRGSGRCHLLLPGASIEEPDRDHEEVVDVPTTQARTRDPFLREHAHSLTVEPEPPPRPPEQPETRFAPTGALTGTTTHRVTFVVQTPVLANPRVYRNVNESLDFVPGTVLLPLVLSRLSREVSRTELVVGDAHPCDVHGTQGLPAPRVWHEGKRGCTAMVNRAVQAAPAERMKPVRGKRFSRAAEEGEWHRVPSRWTVSTHAVVDDLERRPTQETGGVFSVLGIAEATVLATDIVLPSDVTLAIEADDELRIGRSRKDEFGLVRVLSVTQPEPDRPGPVAEGDEVTVWCVSDVLLRDASGAWRPTPAALAFELSRRWGVGVEVVDAQRLKPHSEESIVAGVHAASRRDSMQARWGRPRPTLVGLAAGSVITLRVDADVSPTQLEAAMVSGVGERTTEGFGQVRFGAPEIATPEIVVVDASRAVEYPDCGQGIITELEDEAARRAIRTSVAGLIVSGLDKALPGASQVTSRAQWGSLRELTAGMEADDGQSLRDWIDQTRKVTHRRNAWGCALESIEKLLASDDDQDHRDIWKALEAHMEDWAQITCSLGSQDRLREDLRLTAVRELLEQVSRHATLALQSDSREQV